MTTLTLPRLLTRSLLHRRARSLSALVALTVSAAITTALLTLYADLDSKLHHEFRSFGANIVITAPEGATLPDNALPLARQTAGPDTRIAPFAFAVVTTDRHASVVLAGTDFAAARRLNTWWSLIEAPPAPANQSPVTLSGARGAESKEGRLAGTTRQPGAQPQSPNPALLGAKTAHAITTPTFPLTYNDYTATFRTAATLRTGGDEDTRIYTSLEAFTALTGTGPTVLELQVPGSRAHIDATLTSLQRAFPNLTVAPVRQLVEGESRIVDRTHALMFGAVILVALTVAVSVLATLSAAVLERRRDFALMKALGAPERRLIALFLLETLSLSLTGVLAGFLFGSAAAWSIGRANFSTSTLPHLQVLPLVLLLNLLIATAAALLPTRSLRLLQPAALLKGE